jgi:hypothetical protein
MNPNSTYWREVGRLFQGHLNKIPYRSTLFRLAVSCSLLASLFIAFELRTTGMSPVAQGLLYQVDYDEGVNVTGAQLLLQGFMPYRDFIFVHPPLGLMIFAGVLKIHFVPWGDAEAFVITRYAAIAFGLITIIGVFAVGRVMGGSLSGLVSAALLAIDGLAIEVDRRAMFEAPANSLSVLAVLGYLMALKRNKSRRWWLLGAGAVGACAALVKSVDALSLLSILIYAFARLLAVLISRLRGGSSDTVSEALKERFSELVTLLVGAAITLILIAGYFAVTTPVEFLRQVYIFQLFRPADGTAPDARLAEVAGNNSVHLTIFVALFGLGIVLARGFIQGRWGQWGLVSIWAGSILGLLLASQTFFPHYYVQLAVPLALLAGACVSSAPHGADRSVGKAAASRTRAYVVLALQLGGVAFFLLTNTSAAFKQYDLDEAISTFQSPNLRDVSRFLLTHSAPTAKVMAFEPAYTLVSSREPPRTAGGRFMIDSYGYMQYVNMGLENDWFPESTQLALMDALRGQDAQDVITEIAGRADYIIIEQRARWQLTPETLSEITHGRHVVYRSRGVAIYS